VEEWRDIPGYRRIYQVSNTGKVRTHENKTTHTERHGVRKWKQRELKQKVSTDNCHRVSLWKDNIEKTCLVHRLVAFAFIERPEGKHYINHKDGNRSNNHVDNLEWCDHQEDNNHAFDNGLMTSNVEIVLMNNSTRELAHFRSMAKASEYLGFKKTYLSAALKKGKNVVKNHSVFVKEKQIS